MEDSSDQFLELVAHLTARIDKALSQSNKLPPLGLLLKNNQEIEVILWISEDNDLRSALNELQQRMIDMAKAKGAIAACVAYPDYPTGSVVALLENNQNYCAQYTIPVALEPSLHLDLANVEISDSHSIVFGSNSLRPSD